MIKVLSSPSKYVQGPGAVTDKLKWTENNK